MPRIEEYLPEVNASGPVGDIAPNLTEIGAAGRGLENFGDSAFQAVDAVQKRTEQSEQSQAAATLAINHEQFLQKIQNDTNTGTLNSSQVLQDYDSFVDGQSDNYSTPLGRDYFNKVATRYKASILQKVAQGNQTIAGNNAQSDFSLMMNSSSNVLSSDPLQFEDLHSVAMHFIDSQQKAGNWSQSTIQNFQQDVGKKLSTAAIQGWINSDFESATSQAQKILNAQDDDDSAIPRAEALAQVVGTADGGSAKHMLDNGGFDQYLNEEEKQTLYNKIRQSQSAAVTEINRLITVNQDAQKEQAENWGKQALPQLVKNGLTAKQVLDAPLTWEQQKSWLDMIQAQSKQELVTNPVLKNNLIQRMSLPDSDPQKISDPSQLQKYVGKGLSTNDYDGMTHWFDKTPQGQVLTQNRKMLIDLAKSNLVKGGGIMGQPDPNGEYQLMQFTNALQNQEANLRSQNQPLTSLYDVNSPQFFGKQISNYRKTPEQLMQEQFGKPGQSPAPTNIQTQPGVIPSGKTPPPGLSLEEFKQWKRSNGQ